MSDLNFGDLLDAVAPKVADRPAVMYGSLMRSWREFDERSNRLARRLTELGLRPGSKVAFYLRNSPAYVELLAACFKARLVHVNVNYRYVDDELYYIFDNSDAQVIAYDPEFRPHVDALRSRLGKVKVYFESEIEERRGNSRSLERACRDGDGSPLDIERSGDDLYFMYTGGTTGVPKAVMWPHNQRIEVIGIAQGDTPAEHADSVANAESLPVLLPAAPMMHSNGFTSTVSALCGGGCVVVLPAPRFDAAECLAEIDRCRVTAVAMVGDAFSVPILEELRARGGDYDLSSVQALTSAGAMWSAGNKVELAAYFSNAALRDSLGSSEGSRLASSELRQGGSSETGKFTLGPNARVLTEDFRDVVPGSGEAGLLATSGPIPLGYYKDEARNRETFPTIDGVRFSIPGDWCTVEADGTIQLLGRGSNCINTGGEKVFPEEVEEALKSHADVLDAAVFGVPDPRWGQAVAAVVRIRPAHPVEMATLEEYLKTKLAGYKCPKQLKSVDTSFRAENGKMDYGLAKRLGNWGSE